MKEAARRIAKEKGNILWEKEMERRAKIKK